MGPREFGLIFHHHAWSTTWPPVINDCAWGQKFPPSPPVHSKATSTCSLWSPCGRGPTGRPTLKSFLTTVFSTWSAYILLNAIISGRCLSSLMPFRKVRLLSWNSSKIKVLPKSAQVSHLSCSNCPTESFSAAAAAAALLVQMDFLSDASTMRRSASDVRQASMPVGMAVASQIVEVIQLVDR